MRILVTGANGHLGQNLLRELKSRGHALRASVRSLKDPSKTGSIAALGVEIVEADLDRPRTVRAAMDRIDVVCHAAAVYAIVADGRKDEILKAGIDGVEVAMRAAKDAGVKKFVLTSSVVTLPLTKPGAPPVTEEDWASDLRSPYIRAKTEGERRGWELSRDLGLPLVSILPGAFGGPGFDRNTPTIDLIQSILAGNLAFGAPDINYPYCDVRDVARAHALAVEADCGGRFIACNDESPMLADLARRIKAIDPKVAVPLWTIPDPVLNVAYWLEWGYSKLTGVSRTLAPEMMSTVRGLRWNCSNNRAARVLGWRPEISLRQSLADTIAVIRGNAVRAA
ncbi:MAG: NAD-dependent epimerase/dehydratase family protein [Hyphomicrobiaceae bacterium]|nr:MAG: NAD-dependent epimerase/dehydratase family protein [Hyphomicrobiaceae bacterium]